MGRVGRVHNVLGIVHKKSSCPLRGGGLFRVQPGDKCFPLRALAAPCLVIALFLPAFSRRRVEGLPVQPGKLLAVKPDRPSAALSLPGNGSGPLSLLAFANSAACRVSSGYDLPVLATAGAGFSSLNSTGRVAPNRCFFYARLHHVNGGLRGETLRSAGVLVGQSANPAISRRLSFSSEFGGFLPTRKPL
jgi:hypothetical protein